MKLDELADVAVGRIIPRYSTYMASSFDHPHHLYDRSLGSFPLRQSSDALQEARLHRQMHFAHFSDVPAAARIPCSELAVATACRRLSLRTCERSRMGASGVRECSALEPILRAR